MDTINKPTKLTSGLDRKKTAFSAPATTAKMKSTKSRNKSKNSKGTKAANIKLHSNNCDFSNDGNPEIPLRLSLTHRHDNPSVVDSEDIVNQVKNIHVTDDVITATRRKTKKSSSSAIVKSKKKKRTKTIVVVGGAESRGRVTSDVIVTSCFSKMAVKKELNMNESLRWELAVSDPEQEEERLELYKMNRRKRYLAERHRLGLDCDDTASGSNTSLEHVDACVPSLKYSSQGYHVANRHVRAQHSDNSVHTQNMFHRDTSRNMFHSDTSVVAIRPKSVNSLLTSSGFRPPSHGGSDFPQIAVKSSRSSDVTHIITDSSDPVPVLVN